MEVLRPAFANRYGVGAFNIFNDLTMEAVLAAAEEVRSPVIVQVSLKTVKTTGARLLQLMFQELAARVTIPATLHLDHCPDLDVLRDCLEAGWNSVLFDGSGLSYEENLAQTRRVVEMARRHGAAVEGELEAIKGVEDGVGSEAEGQIVPLDQAIDFLAQTGIDSFAPAIGTAHGVYKTTPKINLKRVEEIVAARPIPIVLHGGTGLSDETFRALIARGAAKMNISTQLKIAYADAYAKYLAAHPTEYDPMKLLQAVRADVKGMVGKFLRTFGSAGQA
jgi:fructose-bisphosphate aldolase class II